MMKKILISVLAIAAICLSLTGCADSSSEPGRLHGKVNIGPLTPVVKEGETYEIPCEVYEARKIMIYEQNGTDLVEEADIDCDGRYSIELKPGKYVVDINHSGIDRSFEVPAEVEIVSGLTTRLDIDIDTGIR